MLANYKKLSIVKIICEESDVFSPGIVFKKEQKLRSKENF